MNPKQKTVLLGVVFLLLLFSAYVENSLFFVSVGDVFSNVPFAVLYVFIHNVLVVSMILLGMTFYVGLVVNFFPKREIEYVILDNPRIFAFVFTLVVILVSILRACVLVNGEVVLDTLGLVVLLSLPNAIIEGYGLFKTIEKVLNRNMTTRALLGIFGIFFVAALIEVGYVQLLRAVI